MISWRSALTCAVLTLGCTQGPPGPEGPTGPAGSAGAAGASVTLEGLDAGSIECPAGGTRLVSASGATVVCNGDAGMQGPPGPPGAYPVVALDGGLIGTGEPTSPLALAPAPVVPSTTQADAHPSCDAIHAAFPTLPDGVYWLDASGGSTADAFEAWCDMNTGGGGWTLVMNVNPSDGNVVAFTNTDFWVTDAEYGDLSARFTNDYKSPASYSMASTEILIAVARPGPAGRVIGWKAWSMSIKSFDSFFDAAANTTQTVSVTGQATASVYAYEPLVRNGVQLQSNRNLNPNADRVRLSATGYTAQGDDNAPGLGTQMNEGICGAGALCYRFADVELWVNSNSNLWCTPPATGSYKWIGSDHGCGSTCDDCEQNAGPGYSPYWTYRVFVR